MPGTLFVRTTYQYCKYCNIHASKLLVYLYLAGQKGFLHGHLVYILIKRCIKSGIQHGYHTAVYTSGCKPIH